MANQKNHKNVKNIHTRRKTTIGIIDFDERHLKETVVTKIEHCLPFRDTPTCTWMNIDDIPSPKSLDMLGLCFKLHPLVLEDIVNPGERPKAQDYEENIYIVLKMLNFDEKTNAVEAEQISIIIGSNFLISIQAGIAGDVFEPIREKIRGGKSITRKLGSDYLAYTLIDIVVDNYFYVLENLGEKIEGLQEKLVRNPNSHTLQAINSLKRQMIFLRKSTWPLRELVYTLERSDSPLIKKATKVYLRDVYDHTVQIIDLVETFRDILSGMLDIYLSSVSNRLNSVMKVLTVITTIFMPLTFIAGIYGMNFKYMPELEARFGYPAVLAVMFIIGLSMFIFFKRKKWI